jgi:hypothetical protein
VLAPGAPFNASWGCWQRSPSVAFTAGSKGAQWLLRLSMGRAVRAPKLHTRALPASGALAGTCCHTVCIMWSSHAAQLQSAAP